MAVIFDIERSGMHDGPGIRTVVFFKGCPLRCRWCHNPESWDTAPQTLVYPEKCISCGGCADGCYTGARTICGQEMTVEQVMAPILADKPYYGTDGGVTLTGGEPQMQADFALALTEACHQHGIGVAIETSMALYRPDLLSKMSLIMADVKLWDDPRHREYTGADNTRILENLRKLSDLGAAIVLRCPIIPGLNDREEHFRGIADIANTHASVLRVEIEPYHSLGKSKAAAIGKEYPLGELKSASKDDAKVWQETIARYTDKEIRIS